jgi:hypothetical protein
MSVDSGMLPDLRIPAGKEIHVKEALEQVIELFRAPASLGCCCSNAAKKPALPE